MKTRILFLTFFLAAFVLQNSVGQETTGERPKIAYVLSGGGAKGMAHLGVLKVLEEVGLQPHIITATSMGSIMGGLYSIGYSAEEISDIIENINWNEVLTNEIPLNQIIMRRKHEYTRYILEMPIYDGKLELPAGVIEGQKLSELFSELAWPQAGVDDFHNFPVEFSCIGTDIVSGQKIEMNSGDLSSAMRASMAIPSVFTAVIRDTSHILVDGGVLRNFPVQEAINMGADVVIGVYVGFETDLKPEQLRSLTSVIARTSLLSGLMDMEYQVPLVDVLIEPDLEGYSPSSFTSGHEIIKRGEEAARARIDDLRALADSINRLGPPPEKKKLPANDSILVQEVKVLSSSPAISDFIIASSGITPGEWIKPDQLNEIINRLFGMLVFEKIEYFFEKTGEDYRLVFRVKEKAGSYLKAAIHYDNTFGPGLILNYTRFNTLKKGSRLGISVDISENPQMRSYYDIHFGKRRNFIGSLFVNAEREELPFYQNNVDIGNYKHTVLSGGLGFRQTLRVNSHIGIDLYDRISIMKLSQNIKEVLPVLDPVNSLTFSGPEAALLFQHNSYDENLFPTRGSCIDIKYRQAFSTISTNRFNFPDSLNIENKQSEKVDPYWHLTFSAENYLPLVDFISINTAVSSGISANDRPDPDSYYVGGYRYDLRANQVAFVGLHSHELMHGNYLRGKIGLQVEARPNLFITALTNLILVSDDINTFAEDIVSWKDEARYLGVGAGFTYKTPIGPLSVFLGSRTDIWNPIWYTNIGFTF